MFVFYDIETTGTDPVFDQILQFAAIYTDENFCEVDRMEIKCRLLPWVVPSPAALLVTKVMPEMLLDDKRVSFYEMVSNVQEQLKRWSPATFIGYNSISFDEQFLQRAFWQALYPPYLTVTNGNNRADVLLITRAIAHFHPDILSWPKSPEGKKVFRLDQLAPANGFNHTNAHDALNDVEATIFIAKLIATRAPNIWQLLVKRSVKKDVLATIESNRPILIFEHRNNSPVAWFGKRLDQTAIHSNEVILTRLDYSWDKLATPDESVLEGILKHTPSPIRRVAVNKAPIIFSYQEAELLFGLTPSSTEISQFDFLNTSNHLTDLISKFMASTRTKYPPGEELEERIFDGFPSTEDERLCEEFHRATWPEKIKIISKFEDRKLRLLAQRAVYILQSPALEPNEREKIEAAITARVLGDGKSKKSWRTRADALSEISKLYADPRFLPIDVAHIEKWLEHYPQEDVRRVYSAK